MIAAAFMLAACFAAEPEGPNPPLQVHAISGQGDLTAGLDASGVLSVLRWPNPGGANMIRAADGEDSIGGGRWGIEINGAWRWFGDPAARVRQSYTLPGSVIETTVEWPDGVVAQQRVSIFPEQDIFTSVLEIAGARSEPRVAYMAAFAPTTRQVPEAGEWEETFDASRTFAAFVDREGERVWNFRPENASKDDWDTARKYADAEASVDAWEKFDDGVWIALSSAGPIRNMAVGGSDKELVGAVDSGATVINAIVGRAVSAIEPAVTKTGETYGAAIAIHVGKGYTSAERELVDVEPEDAPPKALFALLESVQPFAAEHWATLRTLYDGESGFTVRGLASRPSEAIVLPREGALVEWARMLAPDSVPDDIRLDAYLRLVRVDDRPRRPYGSMPESVYTNGEIASPHFVVDDRAPARVMWVAERYVQTLENPDAQSAWIRPNWPVIEAAGEFLSTWADARRGAPLWCDDPVELSDAETQDRLFAAHAGMSAAIRLAETAGEIVPDTWRARRDQLRELADWVLTTPGKWQVGETLVLELDGLSEESILALHENTLRRLENPIGLSARPLASLLLQAALLHRHAPELLDAPSDRVAEDALARIGDMNSTAYAGPDSFVSAQVLIALRLLAAE